MLDLMLRVNGALAPAGWLRRPRWPLLFDALCNLLIVFVLLLLVSYVAHLWASVDALQRAFMLSCLALGRTLLRWGGDV